MKITDIKQQVKRADRYSIYIDGKYSFSLSANELLNQHLKIGQEFNRSQYNEVQQKALEDKAYMRSLDLLARRSRSEWEMEQYLIKKSYDNNTTTRILSKLRKKGLLDDLKFAQIWVADRRRLKNVSKRRLLQELQQKRISKQIIVEVLDNDETNEQDVLRELIIKKRTQTRYQDSQRLTAYLLRQGFNYDDIKLSIIELKIQNS